LKHPGQNKLKGNIKYEEDKRVKAEVDSKQFIDKMLNMGVFNTKKIKEETLIISDFSMTKIKKNYFSSENNLDYSDHNQILNQPSIIEFPSNIEEESPIADSSSYLAGIAGDNYSKPSIKKKDSSTINLNIDKSIENIDNIEKELNEVSAKIQKRAKANTISITVDENITKQERHVKQSKASITLENIDEELEAGLKKHKKSNLIKQPALNTTKNKKTTKIKYKVNTNKEDPNSKQLNPNSELSFQESKNKAEAEARKKEKPLINKSFQSSKTMKSQDSKRSVKIKYGNMVVTCEMNTDTHKVSKNEFKDEVKKKSLAKSLVDSVFLNLERKKNAPLFLAKKMVGDWMKSGEQVAKDILVSRDFVSSLGEEMNSNITHFNKTEHVTFSQEIKDNTGIISGSADSQIGLNLRSGSVNNNNQIQSIVLVKDFVSSMFTNSLNEYNNIVTGQRNPTNNPETNTNTNKNTNTNRPNNVNR